MSVTRPYKIVSDSTTDLPKAIYDKYDVEIVSLSLEIDSKPVAVGEISLHEFYEKMRGGAITKTSQVSPSDFEKVFENDVLAGFDVLYLGFSSAISGTYNSARIARDSVLEKYPDAKILTVDSLCASTGEGLLLIKTCIQKQNGLSIDELEQWILDNRLHVCHMFTVEDLIYLHRGGRVSKTAQIAGSILGIKPVLHLDEEGRLVPVGKVRGRKQSLNKMVELMKEKMGSWDNSLICICHADCEEDAEYVKSQVKQVLGKGTSFIISNTGPVIGAHSGPGTLALFFMGDER